MDIFASVDDVEMDEKTDQGFHEGRLLGAAGGFCAAFDIGAKQGSVIGNELGYMRSCCRMIVSHHTKASPRSAKADKILSIGGELITAIDAFPKQNPRDPSIKAVSPAWSRAR